MNAVIGMLAGLYGSNRLTDLTNAFDLDTSSENLDLVDQSPKQREITFNQLLPYSDKLDDEADALFAKIKANLGRCAMLRDINPGCMVWSQMLAKYIALYGLRFTKDDHIALIKLSYELLTIPDLRPPLVENFAKLLHLLIKKKEILSPDDLELQWEPIYKLYDTLLSRRSKRFPQYKYPYLFDHKLEEIVEVMKIYFPPSATQEILNELRPKLNPFDSDLMLRTLQLLRMFLPVQLPEKYHAIGHELWLHEIMELWEYVCHNNSSWENEIMQLIAKLASNNIGYITWDSYIPLMFARIVHSLGLTVPYKTLNYKMSQYANKDAISEWIASVLGDKSSAQSYLEKFLKTIETYFHPANRGSWSKNLDELYLQITEQVVMRLYRERYNKDTWIYPIPDGHKLTEANIDAFVQSMMPITMTTILNNSCTTNSVRALRNLALMRPNIVIPFVLENLYPALDTNIESHKLVTTMSCMASIARPLVQGSRYYNKDYTYPEGPMNVVSFLLSVLSGLDPNNPHNTYLALQLISMYTTFVPIVDCSKSKAEMDEDERIVCADTSRFEDFVLQLMDKIFTIINSYVLEAIRMESPGNGSREGFLEAMIQTVLRSVFGSLLVQSSDSIFTSALNKLRHFILENSLDRNTAGQQIATVCRVFSKVNGSLTLRTLLPHLSEKILEAIDEIKDNQGGTGEENLDQQLLNALFLLQTIVNTQGNALLPHMNVIVKVLDEVTVLTSREGNQMGCQMLRNVLHSLCNVQAIRFDKDLNDPNYPYWRDWGESVNEETPQIKWYVPGEQEIAAAQNLFTHYFLPAIASIEDYISGKSALTREEIQRMLRIIYHMLEGCGSVLPIWTEPAIVTEPYEFCTLSFKPILGNDYEIKMPDGSNVRHYVVKTMTILQDIILKNVEDDTKILSLLIGIWESVSMNKTILSNSVNIQSLFFEKTRAPVENKLTGNKGFLPSILLERVTVQHELRKITVTNTFTETSKNIIMNLFKLSISPYIEIRADSQRILEQIIDDFPNAYQTIIPHIIEVLQSDTEIHHHAYKGVLHFIAQNSTKLNRKPCSLLTRGDWKVLSELLLALVLSKPSEKTSVIHQHNKISSFMSTEFYTLNIKLHVPDSCVSIATELWNTGMQPSFPKPTESEIQKGLDRLEGIGDKNLKIYNEILDKLVNTIAEKNLHWRHCLRGMTFVEALIDPDHKVPKSIVRYFFNALIHDSIKQRTWAWIVTLHILQQLKRKHPKIELNISNRDNDLKPGPRADNEWLQYKYESRPTNPTQWDESRHMHKQYLGYYTWPKKVEIYAPSSEQPNLKRSIEELDDYEKEIDSFFSDDEKIEKFMTYLTLERKKGQDRFSHRRFLLFKALFRNHGDTYLGKVLPYLEKMVQSKEESVQRCAAEIISGIVRGAKHWPYQMTVNLWENLLPIIGLVLNNITNETMNDWTTCFTKIHQNRDPNRLHWLIEFLASEEHQKVQEVSFTESSKLAMLQCALANQSWRLRELLNRLMPRFESRLLDNPFDNVRGRLAVLLKTIFNVNIKFRKGENDRKTGYPEIDDFINKVYPRLELLLTEQDSKSPEFISASRLLSAVCTLVNICICSSHLGVASSFYKLCPIITQVQNSETDENLSQQCRTVLAMMASSSILPENIPTAMQAIDDLSRSPSWSARVSSMQFLEVFLFNNMSTVWSNERWIGTVTEIVLRLLKDEQIEVREKSAQVLSGMLHCTLISDEQSHLEKFKRLAKTKLRGSDAMRLRHAGVLGMCAFIQAHPYDIPKDILSIFEYLSPHLSDPAPIPSAIRKTLNDFKRTHCDSWTGLQGLAQSMTYEQFSLLQDLTVPPSHYA